MLKVLTGLTLLAVTLPSTLNAQAANCAKRDIVVDRLASKYGEAFAGGGLQNQSRIFEVWMSEEKGTWTILMTRADGSTCIMASGTNWRDGLPAVKTPAGIPG